VWDVEPIAIAASVVEGLGISLDILYIVFGALLLLATLNASGPWRRSGRASRASARTGASRR
jgi:lactate permease